MAFQHSAGEQNTVAADLIGDDENDALIIEILENGEEVYSLYYDGNSPGCSGGSSVYQRQDKFAVSSSDDCQQGPFNTLDEALDANELMLHVTEVTTDVSCTMLTTQELLRKLKRHGDNLKVRLNGETWTYKERG